MASTSDLGKYYEELVTRFDEDTNPDALVPPPVSVVFGRREPHRQDNFGRVGRIVVMYGGPNGEGGEEAACRFPGGDPVPLVDTLDTFTVYVWAHDPDPDNCESELSQHDATDALFRAWRAYTFDHNDFVQVKSRSWVNPKNVERQFGKELQIVCQFRVPVTNAPYVAPSGLTAALNVTSVDVTEAAIITAT